MYLHTDRSHLQVRLCLVRHSLHALVTTWMALASLSSLCVSTAVAATPSPITVSEQDSGKTIELAVGQKILVQLPSNPTTGYQWSVLGKPAPLVFVKSDYAANPQAAGRMGAGGTQILRFAAKSEGKVELKLGYARPSEKDMAPAKTFAVTVVVR